MPGHNSHNNDNNNNHYKDSNSNNDGRNIIKNLSSIAINSRQRISLLKLPNTFFFVRCSTLLSLLLLFLQQSLCLAGLKIEVIIIILVCVSFSVCVFFFLRKLVLWLGRDLAKWKCKYLQQFSPRKFPARLIRSTWLIAGT